MMAKTKANEVTEKNETKFSLEVLRKNCVKLFKVSSATFDGVTCNMEGEYTIDEMKNKIKDWLNKPIGKGGK